MEKHILILWNNALAYENSIKELIKKSSLKIYETEIKHLTGDIFVSFLRRFYGSKLKNPEQKLNYCGQGKILVYYLNDFKPNYVLRSTSSGKKYVNSNVFDLKIKLREITGGGHLIHATDDHLEGYEQTFFLKSEPKFYINDDLIPGDSGWKDFDTFFEYANKQKMIYLILRNYENLDSSIASIEHPDIDLLVSDRNEFSRIMGLKKCHVNEKRSQYFTYIGSKKVYFDLRFVGDKYLPANWGGQYHIY